MQKIPRPEIKYGKSTYYLTSAETLRQNLQIVWSGLADSPQKPNLRFYTTDRLIDLLELHPDATKSGLALPRVYSDLGNDLPRIAETYTDLLSDLTTEIIQIIGDGDKEDERATELVRGWLEDLDVDGFDRFYQNSISGGSIYGTMCVSLAPDIDDSTIMRGIPKDAVSVFPVTLPGTNKIEFVIVYYKAPDQLTGAYIPWVEEYLPSITNVYSNGKIVPYLSTKEGENTGVEEPSFVISPFVYERGEIFGVAPFANLVESVVAVCGLLGSSTRSFRRKVNGITIINLPADELNKVLTALKIDPQEFMAKAMMPDEESLFFGSGGSVSQTSSSVGVDLNALMTAIDGAMKKKSPMYSYVVLGANASGEALKETKIHLEAQIDKIRVNVKIYLTKIVKMLAEFYGTELTGKLKINWGDVFPTSLEDKITQAIELLKNNIIPKRTVADVAGYDGDDQVQEHLDGVEADAEATRSLFNFDEEEEEGEEDE